MATVQETQGQERMKRTLERLNDLTVVDGDVHQISRASELKEYLEHPHKRKINHILATDEPLTQGIGGSALVDNPPHERGEGSIYGLDEDVSPFTPDGIQAFLDSYNSDYVILHGHQMLMNPTIPDQEFRNALLTAYNSYIVDNWLNARDNFKSVINVNPETPSHAVEEIERLADESGMVGININPAEHFLGHRLYEPVYEIAEEKGLPITFHPAINILPWQSSYGGTFTQSNVEDVVGIKSKYFGHLPSLIFQGIPEKYPDLKFVLLESGISWIPWMIGRMNHTYERRKHELSELSKPPGEYISNRIYFGTQPIEDPAGPTNLKKIIELIDGKNTLMYCSDFPHFDFDFPSMLSIPKLSEETERNIFGDNALEVFQF